jgi:hypothetical protein
MTEKRQFRAIKGTRDILPPDSARWNWFEHTAREVFESYNFGEIRLPIFEATPLFARSIGEETDIVSKEMFTWNESGPPIELLLQSAWLLAHKTGIASVQSQQIFVNRLRPDLVVDTPDGRLVVEFKRRTINQASIENIKQHKRIFEQSFPKEKAVRLLFVFAEEPSPVVKRLADINGVEIEVLNLKDYDSEQISLRPEATVSVCRAYIEHNMHARPGNQKLYYIGPMFRRERPQKGRYRQFYQVGAEVLGQSA